MKTEDTYFRDHRPPSAREPSQELRRKYLKYAQAEIVYSLSHKKLLELATAAGAIYRMDSTVLINRDIFDAYLERFHEISVKQEDAYE